MCGIVGIFDLKGIAYALPVIYGISILLSNVVGWVTGTLIKRGFHPLQARKLMIPENRLITPQP